METPEFYLIGAALKFQYGYLIGLTAWQSVVRIVMVFVNAKLKEFAENAIPADKPFIDGIMQSRAYRVTNFLLNALVSIKLPTEARKGAGGTTQIEKPKEP